MKAVKDQNLITIIPEHSDDILDLQLQGTMTADGNPERNIFVDMQNIDLAGSNVIRFMVSLHQHAKREGMKFAAYNIGPQVRKVLEMSRIDKALNLCSSREEALSLLR